MEEKTFIYKARKFTAEGKLCSVGWKYLKKLYSKIITRPINRFFAQRVRNNLARKTPIQENKILFITFQGEYTCNPKYITEELIKRNLHEKLDIVWAGRKKAIKDPSAFPSRVKVVDIYSYEMMRELASAKVIISNSVEYQKRRMPIKPNQVVFQTWHGSFGIKRFDKEHNAGKSWVKAAEINAKTCSYCISNSRFENNVYRGSFWNRPNNKILEYGHPRNDILVNISEKEKNEKVKSLKKFYNIPDDTKTIMYGPTFRDSHTFDCYNIEPQLIIDALSEKFGGNWVFLTRYHPTIRKKRKKLDDIPNILDVSAYADIQELMLLADIAVTDYSSWIYDYVLTRKPAFIFATDIEMYNDERGFYYPLEATPFPIATSAIELANKIREFDSEKYAKDVEAFIDDKGSFEEGTASVKVVDKIVEIMGIK